MTRHYEAALRPAGLRASQFTLLQALETAGEIRQAGLADLLAMDSTTLSRTLQLMEDEAWIRVAPGEDRRERLFRLTRRGRERLRAAKAGWRAAQERFRDAVGRTEWPALLGALDRATRAARRLSP